VNTSTNGARGGRTEDAKLIWTKSSSKCLIRSDKKKNRSRKRSTATNSWEGVEEGLGPNFLLPYPKNIEGKNHHWKISPCAVQRGKTNTHHEGGLRRLLGCLMYKKRSHGAGAHRYGYNNELPRKVPTNVERHALPKYHLGSCSGQ